MGVKTYSLKKDGEKALSKHFKVREFRCKDENDTILVSEELVQKLEKLRAALGCSINVNSGYRTKTHNKKIGGSATSKHCLGLAADIICKRSGKTVPSKEVCCAAQKLGFSGIAYITGSATHVDVRESGRFWADESKQNKPVKDFYLYFGYPNPYTCPLVTVKRGAKGDGVKWVQFQLNRAGFEVAIDGSCGAKTEQAIMRFQKAKGLTQDGKVGRITKAALKRV